MSSMKSSRDLFIEGLDVNLPKNLRLDFDLTWNECIRVCLSKASLKRNNRIIRMQREIINDTLYSISTRSVEKNVPVGGLKRQMKVRKF